MRLADAFPFYKELISPVHDRFLRDRAAQPAKEEVVIDDSWRLIISGTAPEIQLAANDLRDFLDRAMGVRITNSGETADKNIFLLVDTSVGHHQPEAHRLEVSSERIAIAGASPAGVLHGVIFLEDLMRTRRAPFLSSGTFERSPIFKRRIHRSSLSPFYVEELTGISGPPLSLSESGRQMIYTGWQQSDAGPDAFYHDNLLLHLAHHGVNGIWIRGALCLFSKSRAFPEFGERAEEIMAALRRLCQRASKYGISVYLYFNEPLGMPKSSEFWHRHPECKGSYIPYLDTHCLCTSATKTKSFLHDGLAYIFGQVPSLGGVILITASEFPSHCYCHIPTRPGSPTKEELVKKGLLCQRCAEREPQEIVSEVITLIRDGIRSVSNSADIIAWNWSWSLYEDDPQEGILRRLPSDVIVMADFERGITTQALGVEYQNEEYSLKIIGPSDRFKGVAEFLKKHQLKAFARIQIGTTHENPTVPYLPVLQRIVSKYQALKVAEVEGLMTCWNFGNMLSLATEVANAMSWSPQPEDAEAVLLDIAARHFGKKAAPKVVEGWKLISEALEDFPSSVPVLYYGPVGRGPAFPFVLEKIEKPFPRSWLQDVDIEADDLNSWVMPFGAEHIVRCFRSLYERWCKGVDLLLSAVSLAEGEDRKALLREAGVAQMCAIQFRSAANLAEFLLLRNRWYETKEAVESDSLRRKMIAIVQDEYKNCLEAIPLLNADPRLGFHGEAYAYLCSSSGIEIKLSRLRETLKQLQDSQGSS